CRMSRATAVVRASSPGFAVAVEPAPGASDPLALFQAAPADHRFYWEQPSRGVAIAAAGATIALTGTGRDRFVRLAAMLADCPLPPGALAVGGFAFADHLGGAGAWRGFSAAEWVVPQCALVRSERGAHLVATATQDTGAPSLAAILARARASLTRRVVTADPPLTHH